MDRLDRMRQNNPAGNQPILKLNGRDTGNNPMLRNQLRLLEDMGDDVADGYGFSPDREPTFSQIQFYKEKPITTLNGRIDALLHGVTVMLPPEYDLYGYEIRRYMAKIAGPKVITDRKRLAQEITNIRRARVVLDYWQKTLEKEIKEIESIIESNKDIDGSTRSSFKFKRGKVRAMMVEARSWIDNNENMLQMLFDNFGRYTFKEPSFDFRDRETLNKFASLFEARQKSLEIMHAYAPFRMMIY